MIPCSVPISYLVPDECLAPVISLVFGYDFCQRASHISEGHNWISDYRYSLRGVDRHTGATRRNIITWLLVLEVYQDNTPRRVSLEVLRKKYYPVRRFGQGCCLPQFPYLEYPDSKTYLPIVLSLCLFLRQFPTVILLCLIPSKLYFLACVMLQC